MNSVGIGRRESNELAAGTVGSNGNGDEAWWGRPYNDSLAGGDNAGISGAGDTRTDKEGLAGLRIGKLISDKA